MIVHGMGWADESMDSAQPKINLPMCKCNCTSCQPVISTLNATLKTGSSGK